MAWKLPNGKTIQNPRAVQIDGVKYPLTIFRKWSVAELNAIGIYPMREEGYDKKWYKSLYYSDNVVDGELVRIHVTEAKHDVAFVVEKKVKENKQIYKQLVKDAREELDFWDAIGDSDQKAVWSDYIKTLRDKAKVLRSEINAIETYEDIIKVQVDWGVRPDAEEVIDGVQPE